MALVSVPFRSKRTDGRGERALDQERNARLQHRLAAGPLAFERGGELGRDPIVDGALRQVDGAGTLQAQHRCAQIEIVIAQDAVLDPEAAAGLGEVGPLLLRCSRVQAQRHDLAQHAGDVDAEDGPVAQHDLAVAAQAGDELALAVSRSP